MIMNGKTEELKGIISEAKQEIARVIIGQEQVIDQALIAIFTGHHALVEGVPGIGKTLLVRTLAHILGCDFSRIQFTPDLMPTDITGTHVFNMQTNAFSLVKGPVFTTFLLADEINRAPAKTQSALLQAMQERVVTIDRTTHRLSPDFTVFATQNPIEYEGTYPLPEAQKDRFMLKITMETPARDEELTLANRMLAGDAPEEVLSKGRVKKIIDGRKLNVVKQGLEGVTVREELAGYIIDIVRRTRDHHSLLFGAGPRATQALLLAGRALAVMDARDFVTPDDIKFMATPVLEHRLILRPEYEIEGLTVKEVVREILQEITVPR